MCYIIINKESFESYQILDQSEYEASIETLKKKSNLLIVLVKSTVLETKTSSTGNTYNSDENSLNFYNVNLKSFSNQLKNKNWELNNPVISFDTYGRIINSPLITDIKGNTKEIPCNNLSVFKLDLFVDIIKYFDFISQFQDIDHFEKYSNLIESMKTSLHEITIYNGGFIYSEQLNQISNHLIILQKINFLSKKESISQFSFSLSGDFGTGKTTFANILSKFLFSLGILNSEVVVPIKEGDLISENKNDFKKTFQEFLKNNIGNLFLIDLRIINTLDNNIFNDVIEGFINKTGYIFLFEGTKQDLNLYFLKNKSICEKIKFFLEFPEVTNETILKSVILKLEKLDFKIKNLDENQLLESILKIRAKKPFGLDNFYLVNFLTNMILKADFNHKIKFDYMKNEKLKIIDFSSFSNLQ